MEFNEKLQELRKARSLTQEELAEAVFVSVICVAVFIATRQPYAGIVCFALLVTKSLMLSKHVQ